MGRRAISNYEEYERFYKSLVDRKGSHVSFSPPKGVIFKFFDQAISRKAIKKTDDGYAVIGTHCNIMLEANGIIDIWICNTEDISIPLSQKRVRSLLKRLRCPSATQVSELHGEGVVKTKNKLRVLENLAPLGILKRRVDTIEAIETRVSNLKSWHANKALVAKK